VGQQRRAKTVSRRAVDFFAAQLVQKIQPQGRKRFYCITRFFTWARSMHARGAKNLNLEPEMSESKLHKVNFTTSVQTLERAGAIDLATHSAPAARFKILTDF
jgi:hypothetical protein